MPFFSCLLTQINSSVRSSPEIKQPSARAPATRNNKLIVRETLANVCAKKMAYFRKPRKIAAREKQRDEQSVTAMRETTYCIEVRAHASCRDIAYHIVGVWCNLQPVSAGSEASAERAYSGS